MKLENSKTAIDSANDVIDLEVFRSTVPLHESTGKGKTDGLADGRRLVGDGLDFIRPMGITDATRIVKEGKLNFGKFGVLTLDGCACIRCHDTHGIPNAHGNGPDWSIKNLALSPLYVYKSRVVVISRTCTWKYIYPAAKQAQDKVGHYADLAAYAEPIKLAVEEQERKAKLRAAKSR